MSKNVLICPLDWGLGHATRCIPIIRELQAMGHQVLIAGSGPSLDLLKIEFPSNKFFSYSRNIPLLFYLLSKTPSLLSIIKKENQHLKRIVEQEKIDRIISDNRYGCYHRKIPSVIIIHQLSLQLPMVLKGIANSYNARFIRRFNECWVPDAPDRKLSGNLSNSRSIIPKFIGPLSRMTGNSLRPSTYRVLALISGPEPQRTHFETALYRELKDSGVSYYVVRGLPCGNSEERDRTFSHLPSSQLNELIEAADVVVSRSGYSTIMDLAALRKKAIFVPTPGQTEQLYLAKELDRKKIAVMMLQDKFSLKAALRQLHDYTGFTEDYFKGNFLQTTLREFLD